MLCGSCFGEKIPFSLVQIYFGFHCFVRYTKPKAYFFVLIFFFPDSRLHQLWTKGILVFMTGAGQELGFRTFGSAVPEATVL
jgi:hypothetical protein